MKRSNGLLSGLVVILGVASAGRLGAQPKAQALLLEPRAVTDVTGPGLSRTGAVGGTAGSAVVADPKAKGALTLHDLIQLSLQQHPVLRQADFDIQAAQGRAQQAGLYPNPTLTVTGDEMGDRTGPGGIWTAPQINQEIVLGGKLKLGRAVALQEVDQAALALQAQRYVLLTTVRQGYFEVLGAQRRVDILAELTGLANQAHENTLKLLKALQVSKLDVLQTQVELGRFSAELEAARQERRAAWGRLAAGMGVANLPDTPLLGTLETDPPPFDFNAGQAFVQRAHPEARSAQVAVTRAELALRRAQVEPIPNVTVGAGYVRQNQNRSDDWVIQVGLPVPLFNRNQGNVRAAQAGLSHAYEGVRRMENTLAARLWSAYGPYAAARERALRYKSVRDDASEAYKMVLAGYPNQFDVFRLLQAQRMVAESNLEYVRALTDAWRAASEIAGLMLEDEWPLAAAPNKNP